ncbi:MAG TPA: Tad domain-containing protein [bacterium]|nr:Tad domain-containing protein [bacterium]
MKGNSGGVAVIMVMALPILVSAVALVVESGRVALARARLQTAVDRAAYAGASAVAASLNEVAAENWRIHKAWRDLLRDFESDTQQNEDAATARFSVYEESRDEAFQRIDEVRYWVDLEAVSAADDVFLRNAPDAFAIASSEIDIELSEEIDRDVQWGRPGYNFVTGGDFTDPEDVDSGSFDALKFLAKENGPGARIGVFGVQKVRPLVLSAILGDGVEVGAAAAAQAFGGSVEGFAKKETDSLGDAEGSLDEDGSDSLYRASLVPMWTQGESGEGMFH